MIPEDDRGVRGDCGGLGIRYQRGDTFPFHKAEDVACLMRGPGSTLVTQLRKATEP